MNRKQKKWKHVLLTLVLAMLCVAGFNIFSMNRILLDEAQVMGTEIAKRLAAQEMHNPVGAGHAGGLHAAPEPHRGHHRLDVGVPGVRQGPDRAG